MDANRGGADARYRPNARAAVVLHGPRRAAGDDRSPAFFAAFRVAHAEPMKTLRVHGLPVGDGARPLICTPLVARTRAALLAELAIVLSKISDCIEWRVCAMFRATPTWR